MQPMKSFLKYLGIHIAVLLATATSNAAEPLPLEVASLQLGHGVLLTDTKGATLYRYDSDLREPGTSTCTGDCAEKRPPLLATDIPSEIPDDWSLVDREDGTRQWALAGSPLYRYVRDSNKGLAFGEGDGWTSAFEPILTPPDMSIANTILGHVLAAANGLTLYVPENHSESFACFDECLETWQPFEAPWGASDYGEFSVIVRDDGVYQWAYQTRPLYRYLGDAERGEINGDGVDGTWAALVLEPAPPTPSWVTVVSSDGGKIYADPEGKTLHMVVEDKNNLPTTIQGGNHCGEQCLEKYWAPVSADSKEPSTGYWSVIENKDQGLQWAYKGLPLYTLKQVPGPGQELYYTTYRQFQWMKPIMYALPSLQGVF